MITEAGRASGSRGPSGGHGVRLYSWVCTHARGSGTGEDANLTHPSSGTLLNSKKKRRPGTCYKTDDPKNRDAKWKKPDGKSHTLHESTAVKHPESGKHWHRKQTGVYLGWRVGAWVNWNEHRDFSGLVEKVLKWPVAMVARLYKFTKNPWIVPL